mgnify:CR=1 FL=1
MPKIHLSYQWLPDGDAARRQYQIIGLRRFAVMALRRQQPQQDQALHVGHGAVLEEHVGEGVSLGQPPVEEHPGGDEIEHVQHREHDDHDHHDADAGQDIDDRIRDAVDEEDAAGRLDLDDACARMGQTA